MLLATIHRNLNSDRIEMKDIYKNMRQVYPRKKPLLDTHGTSKIRGLLNLEHSLKFKCFKWMKPTSVLGICTQIARLSIRIHTEMNY